MIKDIIKGNIQIALFDGYSLVTPSMRRHPETWLMAYWEKIDNNGLRDVLSSEDSLSYHISWKELMPVVEKIINDNSSSCDFSGLGYHSNYHGEQTYDFSMLTDDVRQVDGSSKTSLIEACWLAVVKYCKHYNEKNHDTTGD